MHATTTTNQLTLLPETPPAVEDAVVALADLPPDDLLAGPAPSKALRESVARLGLLEPVLVAADASAGEQAGARYLVLDGRRRIKAARAAGLTRIPVRLVAGGDAYAGALTLVSHATRRDNAAAEVAAIRGLLRRGASEEQIGRATGLPLPTIRRRLRLAGLHGALFDLFAAGELAAGVAEQAARLPPAAQAGLAATWQIEGRLTAADVRETRTARRADRVDALPDGLFAPSAAPLPADAGGTDAWRADVAERLRAVEALLPADAPPAVRAALDALLALVCPGA